VASVGRAPQFTYELDPPRSFSPVGRGLHEVEHRQRSPESCREVDRQPLEILERRDPLTVACELVIRRPQLARDFVAEVERAGAPVSCIGRRQPTHLLTP
jgi:hypothetical protein